MSLLAHASLRVFLIHDYILCIMLYVIISCILLYVTLCKGLPIHDYILYCTVCAQAFADGDLETEFLEEKRQVENRRLGYGKIGDSDTAK